MKFLDKSEAGRHLPHRHLLFAALCQLALLLWACPRHRYLLNPDGIAYLRIARYVQEGNADLMVSGYWGVLLSWFIAPLLALGINDLLAARIVMVFGSFVFLGGAVTTFAVFDLSKRKLVTATWLTVFANVGWTFRLIAPDQLVSGLLCMGTAVAISETWTEKTSRSILSGMLFGIAYLAKAVAFPLAFLLTGLGGGMQRLIRGKTFSATCNTCMISTCVFLIVASPWLIVLSKRYGRVTFSTSGKINHAIFGPKDVDRFHPAFRTYHRPEPGRLTQWEKPSVMAYQYWSPLSSAQYFIFQFVRIIKNCVHISVNLLKFDLFGLGFLSLFVGFLIPFPRSNQLAASPWHLAFLPVVTMAAIYLPVYNKDLRYYYAMYPFLLVAALHLPETLTAIPWFQERSKLIRFIAFLVPLSFVLGGISAFLIAVQGVDGQKAEFDAAQYIRKHNLQGPVGDVRGKNGMYLAYFLDQPWYGSESGPLPEAIVKAGIKLLCVSADAPLTRSLQQHSAFRRIDQNIFENGRVPYLIFVVK